MVHRQIWQEPRLALSSLLGDVPITAPSTAWHDQPAVAPRAKLWLRPVAETRNSQDSRCLHIEFGPGNGKGPQGRK